MEDFIFKNRPSPYPMDAAKVNTEKTPYYQQS